MSKQSIAWDSPLGGRYTHMHTHAHTPVLSCCKTAVTWLCLSCQGEQSSKLHLQSVMLLACMCGLPDLLCSNHLLQTVHWADPHCSRTGFSLSLLHLCRFLSLSRLNFLEHMSQVTSHVPTDSWSAALSSILLFRPNCTQPSTLLWMRWLHTTCFQ